MQSKWTGFIGKIKESGTVSKDGPRSWMLSLFIAREWRSILFPILNQRLASRRHSRNKCERENEKKETEADHFVKAAHSVSLPVV